MCVRERERGGGGELCTFTHVCGEGRAGECVCMCVCVCVLWVSVYTEHIPLFCVSKNLHLSCSTPCLHTGILPNAPHIYHLHPHKATWLQL